ncbi:lanthionine synthetase C family protein [Maribacter sp. 2-571]|uniref:lanthionine synthetase C family protein n=1 Tax=Maribacter sp. 2-571 TaxID=3417569 RepID=UPI003D35605E
MDRILKSKIHEIKGSLLNPSSVNTSLLAGTLGEILFLFYYAEEFKDEETKNFADKLLDKVLEKIQKQRGTYLYSDGLSGFGWLMIHLKEKKFIDIDIEYMFEDLDENFEKSVDYLIKNNDLDFLHGAIGIGFFYLKRDNGLVRNRILKKIICSINESAIIVGKHAKWASYDYEKKEFDNTKVNMGLAHGVPSILSFLVNCARQRIHSEITIPLITKSADYILDNQLEQNAYNCHFPFYIDSEPLRSRMGWCYGDMGVCSALWKSGVFLENRRILDRVIEIMDDNVLREDLRLNMVNDAGLCHGTGGVAVIFQRMYYNTGRKNYAKAADFWYNKTLEKGNRPTGLAGYESCYSATKEQLNLKKFVANNGFVEGEMKWASSRGFLDGISGIGLALLSRLNKRNMVWDEALLIS